ncbi:putative disease resistance protein At3g14460, partial [Capsicum annuum]|uniref:putative disease resistance protein At3g14460 n=1 Tax=Capsicum annuum TaxID=4072 RepID=UPI001FB0AEA9
YGSLSSKKPFNSLEELEFAEMTEWKQWHVPGNGEFPTLEKLSLSKCPELCLETPIQLSSLKEFHVTDSPKVGVLFDEAELFTSQLQGMKQIVRLSITDCNSLASLPISIQPSTLKRIKISRCRKLKLERPVGYCDMFLEELKLVDCDSIADTSSAEYELVPRARDLNVSSCHSLSGFLIPTRAEELEIWNCENLEILSVAGGTQITSLCIENCEKLKWLPERMQELVPSLKRLTLGNCPEIESFPEGGLLFNLECLWICNCRKLVNGRKEWCLQRLSCLRMLAIEHDGSDEEILTDENWELPCSVRTLHISNLKTLSSQLLKSLTSLVLIELY